MATLIAGSDSGVNGDVTFPDDGYTLLGTAFTAGAAGLVLDSAQFKLNLVGSPTGNAFAYLYSVTGTVGTNAKPTGSALATSDSFNVASLNGTPTLSTFTFSAANRIAVSNGTAYAVLFGYTGGTSGVNSVQVSFKGNPPSGSFNEAYLVSGAFGSASGQYPCFDVYGATPVSTMTGISSIQGISTVTF